MSREQTFGVIELGLAPDALDDYSGEISNFTVTQSRATVTRRPTYGNPEEQTRAGAKAPGSVAFDFDSDEADPIGVYSLVADAYDTDSAIIYYSARYKAGPASVDNPRVTGAMVVTQFNTGTPVGEWKAQTQTFPSHDIVRHTDGS